MNLLRDPWLPVALGGTLRHAALKEVLCSDADFRLSLARDDMELAALQLAICLTQVILPPADIRELHQRVAEPLPGRDYDAAVVPLADWFDLRHARHPFMQVRGVKAKEATPIQKLFVGLPAGDKSPALFNPPGEVAAVCPSCAAIALFHQATNCPSFGGGPGGGFKGTLRGDAPVTTLIAGENFRKTLWRNVLTKEAVDALRLGDWGKPVWVEPIRRGATILVPGIGLLRGLFWQPAHVELAWEQRPFTCAGCGRRASGACSQFAKEPFGYKLGNEAAQWPHPHSPREWSLGVGGGRRSERSVSLRRTAPAWTQLGGFLLERETRKEGGVPAPVVLQFRKAFRGQRLTLLVGGFRNKQAKILERRHELISLAEGWGDDMDSVRVAIDRALEIKEILRKKTYGFGKKVCSTGIARQAEQRFYSLSEEPIHGLLRRWDWREAGAIVQGMTRELSATAEAIFHELAAPYMHQPKALKRYFTVRRVLRQELARLGRVA